VCENASLNDPTLVPNQLNNEGRLYPNVYYWVASHFVGDNVVLSAIAIRVINVLLFLGLVALLSRCSDAAVFNAVVLSIIVMWVPLGLFLVASNNGSSWTLTGVSLYWGFLYSLLHCQHGRQKWFAACGLIFSVTMAAGSRADGSLYLAVISVSLVFVLWKDMSNRQGRMIGIGVVASTTLIAVLVYLTTEQSRAFGAGLMAGDNFGRSATEVLWTNTFRLPGYFLGFFGIGGFGSGLGWIDTPMEPLTWLVMFAITVAILSRPRSRATLRSRYTNVFLFGVLLALPTYMYFLDRSIVGENVQSRYMLPFATSLFGLAVLPIVKEAAHNAWSREFKLLLVVAMSTAHAAALHTNMRRYISGLDVLGPNLEMGREWWPTWVPPPNITWASGTVGFGLVAYLLVFKKLKDTQELRPAELD